MRNRLNLLTSCVIALGMIFLTGCNNEETPFDDNPISGEGQLSFVLPLGSSKVVTYAAGDPVTGEDDEYELENLFIYWFQFDGTSDYTLYKTFAYGTGTDGSITLAHNTAAASNTTVATVTVGDASTKSHFYILANVNGSSIAAARLGGLATGANATDFEQIAADALAVQDGSFVPIACPLPMSISKSTTMATGGANGYVEVNNPSTTASVDGVHLKRRVARFDILNTSDYSNFEITRIIVNRPQKTGWLQDIDFDPANLPTWATNAGVSIFDGTNANGTPSPRVDAIDDNGNPNPDGIYDVYQNGGVSDNDAGKYESNKRIFYLWPTVLKQNASPADSSWIADPADGTEIMIEGNFYNGTTRLYKLTLVKDFNIEANKVYQIKVNRLAENIMRFDLLTVDHWEEADTLVTANAGNDVKFDNSSITATGTSYASIAALNLTPGVADELTYTSSKTDSVKITVVTEGTNLKGGHTTTLAFRSVGTAGTDYLASDFTDISAYVTSSTVLTYATHYVTTHVITLPPTDAPLDAVLEIGNPANPDQTQKVNLHSNNVDKSGKQLMQVGQVLDASTAATGQGRWMLGVVTAVAAPATTLPSKYDNTFGAATQVFAKLGNISKTDLTNFSNSNANTPTAIINYLNTNNGGNAMVRTGGETYSPNLPGTGGLLIPASLENAVVSGLGITSVTDNSSYNAIVVNCARNSTPSLPVFAAGCKVNIRGADTAIKGYYTNAQITALINY